MPSHSQHALALWKVRREEVGKRCGNVALEKSEQGDFAPEGARELHQLFLGPVTVRLQCT